MFSRSSGSRDAFLNTRTRSDGPRQSSQSSREMNRTFRVKDRSSRADSISSNRSVQEIFGSGSDIYSKSRSVAYARSDDSESNASWDRDSLEGGKRSKRTSASKSATNTKVVTKRESRSSSVKKETSRSSTSINEAGNEKKKSRSKVDISALVDRLSKSKSRDRSADADLRSSRNKRSEVVHSGKSSQKRNDRHGDEPVKLRRSDTFDMDEDEVAVRKKRQGEPGSRSRDYDTPGVVWPTNNDPADEDASSYQVTVRVRPGGQSNYDTSTFTRRKKTERIDVRKRWSLGMEDDGLHISGDDVAFGSDATPRGGVSCVDIPPLISSHHTSPDSPEFASRDYALSNPDLSGWKSDFSLRRVEVSGKQVVETESADKDARYARARTDSEKARSESPQRRLNVFFNTETNEYPRGKVTCSVTEVSAHTVHKEGESDLRRPVMRNNRRDLDEILDRAAKRRSLRITQTNGDSPSVGKPSSNRDARNDENGSVSYRNLFASPSDSGERGNKQRSRQPEDTHLAAGSGSKSTNNGSSRDRPSSRFKSIFKTHDGESGRDTGLTGKSSSPVRESDKVDEVDRSERSDELRAAESPFLMPAVEGPTGDNDTRRNLDRSSDGSNCVTPQRETSPLKDEELLWRHSLKVSKATDGEEGFRKSTVPATNGNDSEKSGSVTPKRESSPPKGEESSSWLRPLKSGGKRTPDRSTRGSNSERNSDGSYSASPKHVVSSVKDTDPPLCPQPTQSDKKFNLSELSSPSKERVTLRSRIRGDDGKRPVSLLLQKSSSPEPVEGETRARSWRSASPEKQSVWTPKRDRSPVRDGGPASWRKRLKPVAGSLRSSDDAQPTEESRCADNAAPRFSIRESVDRSARKQQEKRDIIKEKGSVKKEDEPDKVAQSTSGTCHDSGSYDPDDAVSDRLTGSPADVFQCGAVDLQKEEIEEVLAVGSDSGISDSAAHPTADENEPPTQLEAVSEKAEEPSELWPGSAEMPEDTRGKPITHSRDRDSSDELSPDLVKVAKRSGAGGKAVKESTDSQKPSDEGVPHAERETIPAARLSEIQESAPLVIASGGPGSLNRIGANAKRFVKSTIKNDELSMPDAVSNEEVPSRPRRSSKSGHHKNTKKDKCSDLLSKDLPGKAEAKEIKRSGTKSGVLRKTRDTDSSRSAHQQTRTIGSRGADADDDADSIIAVDEVLSDVDDTFSDVSDVSVDIELEMARMELSSTQEESGSRVNKQLAAVRDDLIVFSSTEEAAEAAEAAARQQEPAAPAPAPAPASSLQQQQPAPPPDVAAPAPAAAAASTAGPVSNSSSSFSTASSGPPDMDLKRQELLFQDQLLKRDLELTTLRESYAKMKQEMAASQQKFNKVVGLYSSSLQEMSAEREQQQLELQRAVKQLTAERDDAREEVTRIEAMFAEMHRKYEKSKLLMSENRVALDSQSEQLKQLTGQVSREKQRYDMLKQYAEDAMQRLRAEMDTKLNAKETEVLGMSAKLQLSENRVAKLERENAEVTAICNELIQKMGPR